MNDFKLKRDFDRARTRLLEYLFDAYSAPDPACIEAALDQMKRAFYELLVSTLPNIETVQPDPTDSSEREIVCAHAVHDELSGGSHWKVLYVDGQPIAGSDTPPSVRDFTKHMLSKGWEVVSPQTVGISPSTSAQSVCELYFARKVKHAVSGSSYTANNSSKFASSPN